MQSKYLSVKILHRRAGKPAQQQKQPLERGFLRTGVLPPLSGFSDTIEEGTSSHHYCQQLWDHHPNPAPHLPLTPQPAAQTRSSSLKSSTEFILRFQLTRGVCQVSHQANQPCRTPIHTDGNQQQSHSEPQPPTEPDRGLQTGMAKHATDPNFTRTRLVLL